MGKTSRAEAKATEAKKENVASQKQNMDISQSIGSHEEQILFLQRTIGNQAVGRLIKFRALQAKLKKVHPINIHEQEADRVAEQMIWMPEQQIQQQSKIEQEERIQTRPLAVSPILQWYETEEDEYQLRSSQTLSSSTLINIRSLGSGSPLSITIRERVEPMLGAGLGHVRVHDDRTAQAAAHSLHAKAFTHQNNFRSSVNSDPNYTQLMAHELTHVVQQTENNHRESDGPSKDVSIEALNAGVHIQRWELPSWKDIKSVGETAVDWLARSAGVLSNLKNQASLILEGVMNKARTAGTNVINKANQVAANIKNSWSQIKSLVVIEIEGIENKIKSFLSNVCKWACSKSVKVLGDALVILVRKADSSWTKLKTMAGSAYAQLNRGWIMLTDLVGSIFNSITNKTGSILNWFKEKIGSILGSPVARTTPILELIQRGLGWLETKVNSILSIIKNVEISINNSIKNIINNIKNLAESVWNPIKQKISPILKHVDTVKKLFRDLTRVDWMAPFDTRGLKGHWFELFLAWACETSPSGLGVWSIEKGEPLVTITSGGYIDDLKSKPHYQETLNKFKTEHPDVNKIRVGDYTKNNFGFTGPGSASGKYNALEWFLGSYGMIIKVIRLDTAKKIVKVEVVVSNKSHWESATRLPQSWINRGLPRSLIPDSARKDCGVGGTFNQKFIWEDSIQYNSEARNKYTSLVNLIVY